MSADGRDSHNKAVSLKAAIIAISIILVVMFVAIVLLKTSPQVPLLFACLISCIPALRAGYTLREIGRGIWQTLGNAKEAIFILMLIGMLVASWLAAGTMPAIIYGGLAVLSPKIFLPAVFAVTGLIACAIGSWGAAGTIGLAFMGIGDALNMPASVVAGAIIAGAYCGEIVSPLSDASNLSAAVAERSVLTLCSRSLRISLPGIAIALVFYSLLGLRYVPDDAAAVRSGVEALNSVIKDNFQLSFLCILPLILVVGCLLARLPALPALGAGVLGGVIISLLLQGAAFLPLIRSLFIGYESVTGDTFADTLLSGGGLFSMLEVIAVIVLAMSFGGIMLTTGQTHILVRPLVEKAAKKGCMTILTVVTTLIVNLIIPDQYLSITLPSQMYGQSYDEQGLSRTDFGATLLTTGTLESPLIPWNTCGLYCSSVLGIATFAYLPFAIFNLVTPFVSILASKLYYARKK